MQTPLWVPLVVAAIGVLGTLAGGIAGVLITQRRADTREAVAWQRHRDRERELWQREDMLRTFDQRRTAYVDLVSAIEDLRQQLGRFRGEGPAPDFGAVRSKLDVAKIYGTPDVIRLAAEATINAEVWLEGLYGTSREEMDALFWSPSSTPEALACRDSAEALLDKVRDELWVSGGSARVKPFGFDI